MQRNWIIVHQNFQMLVSATLSLFFWINESFVAIKGKDRKKKKHFHYLTTLQQVYHSWTGLAVTLKVTLQWYWKAAVSFHLSPVQKFFRGIQQTSLIAQASNTIILWNLRFYYPYFNYLSSHTSLHPPWNISSFNSTCPYAPSMHQFSERSHIGFFTTT